MNQHRFSPIINYLAEKISIHPYDVIKLLLSSCTFFFVIGAYSVLRSLKTSIFLGFVGPAYEPYAKVIAIAVTIPTMMIYSHVVDRLKKHQAVYFFIGTYAILSVIFAYFFAHPVYGLQNTQTSPYRLLGWFFEIAMDLFQALVVGTFWSFINSISTPAFAGRSYGFIVAGSRIGGILTPLISWLILEHSGIESSISIPLMTASNSLLLIGAGFCIYYMRKLVPESYLHGYEAAHKEEDKNQKKDKKPGFSGTLEGFKLMLTQPYVMGIFGLVFSYEIINIIFDYQMHILMSVETNNNVLGMSTFMLLYTGTFQTLSLFFALIGTTSLLKIFGVRYCLMVMPVACAILAILPVIYPRLLVIFVVMVILRALNYGFNQPLREILFIPTIKDIQFKSKAWIESFGRSISKATGSGLNIVSVVHSSYVAILIGSGFSVAISLVWVSIAYFIGKTYVKTIANNDVIGKQD